jgi:hypothetical protein
MSLFKDKDLTVAAAVTAVLEGKVQKEEMDPKDHVKEIDGGESFVVVDKDGKAVAKFKDRKEADDYAKENHTDLMAGSGDDEKDEVDESVDVNEAIDAGDYTVGAEKSKKGYRTKVTHTEKGHTMYLAAVSYKDEKTALAHAQTYLDVYAQRGDRASNNAALDFQKKNAKNVAEVAEPEAQGEKDFKDKHVVKKSGAESDGTIVKEEVTITIDEAKLKAGKGKETIDVDFIGDKDDAKAAEKKFKIKIKMSGDTADVTGEKKNIIAWLSSDMYGMDSEDIEDIFPELLEATDLDEGIMSEIDAMLQDGKTAAQIAKALKLNLKDVTKIIKTFGEAVEIPKEESDKQKKYQAFFKKALAKFGVKSPSELEKDKRAEFFDYVDANYEADNEED